MANPIKSALFMTYPLSGALQVTVTDVSQSAVLKTVVPAGTTSYQTFLGALHTTADGTQFAPFNLASKLQGQLSDARWTVGITNTGFMTIAYLTTGTTASITWNSTTLRNILGFTGSLAFSGSVMAHTSAYQPFGILWTTCREGDTGNQFEPGFSAYATAPDGQVYGFSDGFTKTTRTFNLRYHPDSFATQVSRSSWSTPMYPASASFANNPGTPNSFIPPFSVQSFMHHGRGQMINAFLGTLQEAFSGSVKMHLCFLSPKTIAQVDNIRPSMPNYKQLLDWNNLELTISGGYGI